MEMVIDRVMALQFIIYSGSNYQLVGRERAQFVLRTNQRQRYITAGEICESVLRMDVWRDGLCEKLSRM